jgi:hypothetical protein
MKKLTNFYFHWVFAKLEIYFWDILKERKKALEIIATSRRRNSTRNPNDLSRSRKLRNIYSFFSTRKCRRDEKFSDNSSS